MIIVEENKEGEIEMSIYRNEPTFHVVVPEPPFHPDCGHYHDSGAECPAGRCDSYLCCVPGGDVEPTEPEVTYENRAAYGMCAKCLTHLPLLGDAGLTACCNQGIVYI